jgi:hypothetical protein
MRSATTILGHLSARPASASSAVMYGWRSSMRAVALRRGLRDCAF